MPEFDTVMPPAGVYFYLDVSGLESTRTTTTTVSGTRYQIVGDFVYDEMVGFTVSGDELTYIGPGDKFELLMSVGHKIDTPGKRGHVSFWFKDGAAAYAELTGSVAGTYLKTALEAQALPLSMVVVELATGDKLKIMTWSNSAGADLIGTHISVKIRPWGR